MHTPERKISTHRILWGSLLMLCAAALMLQFSLPNSTTAAATLPENFTEVPLADDLGPVTTFRFAPDGRLFIAVQNGELRIMLPGGTMLQDAAIDLTVDSTQERGLIGLAFDPNFASNNYIYLHYTVPGDSENAPRNRVSRFTMNGNVIDENSEDPLINMDDLSSANNHNGGALGFGADGKLYIAVGDNANSANSQNLSNVLGKMLRINSDGTIPTDNPFYSQLTGKDRAIWAYGLRNPFNFAVQPGTGRLVLNDVGQSSWEEINDGKAGANYGWPNTEGETTNPAYTSPLYVYANGDNCSIVGAAFYNPPTQQFPNEYVGDYFFGDLCGRWIRHYDFASDQATEFVSNTASQLVDIQIASDGSLYYLARGNGGSVYRISYDAPVTTPATNTPIATATATNEPTATSTNQPTPTATSTPQSGAVELIANGGFETGSGADPSQPASWDVKNTTGDKLKCNKPEKVIANSGECAFKFKGKPGEQARLKQLAPAFEVQPGETLSLSVFVWAKNVQPGLNRVKVVVVYPTAPKEKMLLTVDQNGTGYEELTASASAPETPDKIKVIVNSRSETGRTLIDDFSLIANEAAVLPLP